MKSNLCYTTHTNCDGSTCDLRPETKWLDWSYPTSDNAKAAGFYSQGCWTLSVYRGWQWVRQLGNFASKAEALKAAAALTLEWHPEFTRISPETLNGGAK